MAGVRAAGNAGEASAGIVKNTQRIPSLSGNAAYRIPDELGNGVLGEVKNVSSLSYSSQLRDFAGYAQQRGLQFNLYVRRNVFGVVIDNARATSVTLRSRSRTSSTARRRNSAAYFDGRAMTTVSYPRSLPATK